MPPAWAGHIRRKLATSSPPHRKPAPRCDAPHRQPAQSPWFKVATSCLLRPLHAAAKAPPPPPPLHIAEQQLALPLRLPKRTKHKPPSLGTSAQRATLRIVVSAVGEPLVADLHFSQKAWRSTCSALVVRTPISPGWCGGRGACLKSMEHVILPGVTFVMPRRLPPDPQASCTSPPPPPSRAPTPGQRRLGQSFNCTDLAVLAARSAGRVSCARMLTWLHIATARPPDAWTCGPAPEQPTKACTESLALQV